MPEPASDRLSALLAQRPWLLADGATGTNYFALGLETGDAPELWVLERPELVEGLHRRFIEAGSDIILTNSFGGTRHRLKLHGAENRAAELNRAAAAIARRAANAGGRAVVVAGSMGPSGEILAPLGELAPEEAEASFAEQAAALAEGGADVLWIETMSSAEELRAAHAGAAAAGLPIVCTMSFDTNGRTMMGITPAGLAELTRDLAPRPLAFGANCGTGAAELMGSMLKLVAVRTPEEVLVAKGNCGIPQYQDGHIHYTGTPELMADYARLAADAGVQIIGGCCGTTPEHIKAMHDALANHQRGAPPELAEIEARLGAVSVDRAEPAGGGRGGRGRGRRRSAVERGPAASTTESEVQG